MQNARNKVPNEDGFTPNAEHLAKAMELMIRFLQRQDMSKREIEHNLKQMVDPVYEHLEHFYKDIVNTSVAITRKEKIDGNEELRYEISEALDKIYEELGKGKNSLHEPPANVVARQFYSLVKVYARLKIRGKLSKDDDHVIIDALRLCAWGLKNTFGKFEEELDKYR